MMCENLNPYKAGILSNKYEGMRSRMLKIKTMQNSVKQYQII